MGAYPRREGRSLATKTNAIRALERAGIAFELRTYELDLEAFSAQAVAERVGLPPTHVFKTLAARGDPSGPCLAVVPASSDLDRKALARAAGDRRTAMVPVKEVEALTGYPRGAVTALGARRGLPVYLDSSALDLDRMAVSGGRKGVQVLLAPSDYVRLTHATVATIARAT